MANYKVSATLSARDQGFSSTMQKAVSSMNGVDSTAGRLSQRLKQGLGFGVVMAVGQKAVNAVTGAVRGMASQVGNAVNRFDTLNNFPKIMKNLGYSTKDAKKALSTMSEGIDGLPTSLDSIASASQKIAPLTGNLDKAAKVTVAMNNALLAGGKSAETQSNALEQFSQMLSAGKVDMQAWRSMLDAMPGQMNQLAQSLLGADKNQADLYEAMKAGTVSFDDFNNALLQLNEKGLKAGGKEFASFAEQAKSATGGIGTQIANLKTGVVKGITSMITEADKTLHIGSGIKKMSEGIKGTLDKVAKSKTFKIMLGGIKAFIKGAVPVVREFAKAFGAVIAATAKAASKSGALKGALSGLKDMLIGAAKWIQQNSDTVVKLAKAAVVLWAAFKGYKIISSVTGGVRMLTSGITGLIGTSSKLLPAVSGATSGLSKMGGILSKVSLGSAGLVGAIAGIGVATGAVIAKSYKEWKKYEGLGEKAVQASNKRIEATESEGRVAETYGNKLTALMGKENKSASDKRRIARYVDILNDKVDGLNLKYDEEADKLNKTTREIKNNIKAMQEQARTAAYQKEVEQQAQNSLKWEKKLDKEWQKLGQNGMYANGVDVGNRQQIQDLAKDISEAAEAQDYYAAMASGASKAEAEQAVQIGFASQRFTDLATQTGISGAATREWSYSLMQAMMNGSVQVPQTVEAMKQALNFDSIVTKAEQDGYKVPAGLSQGILSGKYVMPTTAKQLEQAVTFRNLWTRAKLSGAKIPTGLMNGMLSGKSKVKTGSEGLQGIINFYKLKQKAQKAGADIPKGLEKKMLSGKITVQKATKQLSDATGVELKKGNKKQAQEGEKGPKEYARGIQKAQPAVKKASKQTVKNANTGANGSYEGGKGKGGRWAIGYAAGISSNTSYIRSAARSAVKEATNTAGSTQKDGSPSRVMKLHGKYWYQGYVKGMASGLSRVRAAASKVINQAFKGMHIATGKGFRAWGQSFTGLANKYINRLTNKVNAQVSKRTYRVSASISKAVNKQVKSLKAQKKARKELINNLEKVKESLKTKYSKYLEKEGNKLINTATKTLNKLANKYQKAYQKIVEAKNTFVGNLKSYGSLYQADSYGFITFENWGQDIKDIKAVTKNLKQLKKWGISQGLLNQITAMSTGDQLKFTSEIIKKGKQFFKTYNKGYTNFIKQSNKAGTAIYGSYVKALDKKYNKELKKTLNGLKTDLTNIGKQAGKGLINGLSNKDTKKKLQAVSKTLAQSIIKQIRKTLKIHSPSRVMAGLATQTGQGFINGLNAMSRSVQQASANMLQLPDLALQGAGLASVTGGQNLSLQGGMSIEVPLYINGREFARATAADMQNAINKRETRSSRNRGVR